MLTASACAPMSRIFGKFESKDLVGLAMKVPVPVIVNCVSSLPQNASTQELKQVFQGCFFPRFLDVIEWTPPDLRGSTHIILVSASLVYTRPSVVYERIMRAL